MRSLRTIVEPQSMQAFLLRRDGRVATHRARCTTRSRSCRKARMNEYSPIAGRSAAAAMQPGVRGDCRARRSLPAYAFWRILRARRELRRHEDRNACEVSASLRSSRCRDERLADPRTGTSTAPKRGVALNPGDAIVYQGCRIPHWREPFAGERQYQVFLHYVSMPTAKTAIRVRPARRVAAPRLICGIRATLAQNRAFVNKSRCHPRPALPFSPRMQNPRSRMSRKPVPAQSGERSRVELTFDKPQLLAQLFGQYDQNLVALEHRLGIYITARGNRIGLGGHGRAGRDGARRAQRSVRAHPARRGCRYRAWSMRRSRWRPNRCSTASSARRPAATRRRS